MLGLCLIVDPRLIYGVVFILPAVHCGHACCVIGSGESIKDAELGSSHIRGIITG